MTEKDHRESQFILPQRIRLIKRMVLSDHRMHGNNLINLCESVEKRYELDELNE